MADRKFQVTVIGASDDTVNFDAAYKIGSFIGENKYTLISGGRGGIMEAVSRGALEAGGLTIGILPGETDEEANPYTSVVIPTGIGYARNSMNVLAGDVIIALGGKAGTLSELAYAWHYGKTIIACTFCSGWSSDVAGHPPDDRNSGKILTASTVAEACSHIMKCAEEFLL